MLDHGGLGSFEETKSDQRYKMKTTMKMLTLLVMLGGCSTALSKPDNSYERQNAAAAKAHADFDKE